MCWSKDWVTAATTPWHTVILYGMTSSQAQQRGGSASSGTPRAGAVSAAPAVAAARAPGCVAAVSLGPLLLQVHELD